MAFLKTPFTLKRDFLMKNNQMSLSEIESINTMPMLFEPLCKEGFVHMVFLAHFDL